VRAIFIGRETWQSSNNKHSQILPQASTLI